MCSGRGRLGGRRLLKPGYLIAIAVCSALLVSHRSTPGETAGSSPISPPGGAVGVEAPPAANDILRNVVARLPHEPLAIMGSLTTRKPKGVVVRSLNFDLLADWGSRPARVQYTLRDAFGSTLEQLTMTRDSSNKTGFAYARGSPLEPAPRPGLFDAIQGTDVSWIDLTLAFLWWPGGKVTGEEKIKGHLCDVIELPAPADRAGEAGADSPYSRVRLWIDRKHCMLLQAEGYDHGGRALRRLWAKGFKKINERWMIKEMEIQSYPVLHRTKLLIHDVRPANVPFPPGAQGGDVQKERGNAAAAGPGRDDAAPGSTRGAP
jgi:hypothetical protein